ncbi:cuticular protein RR-1 family member 57 precursor [Nasonia vitripennis]|uniref:Uncharacterized protein n=1 Tax=Nasonia vitripennis TaxID=7425 RepID=A0A7M6ULZ2_NASVI|nr:cuticular protein RR-1 family member 57 precursor [Nasonia vitripennis]
MKTIVVFAALVAVALAAVPRRRQVSPPGSETIVLKEQLHDNIGLDGYQYSYELSDGSAKQESSQIEVRGNEDATNRVTGSYRWVDELGQEYVITYVADENGFQPQGAHLPTPPSAL